MKQLLILIIMVVFSNLTNAQEINEVELFNTLKAKDSLIFELGFNNCETVRFEELISEDFEFYHDLSGMQSSKAEFINVMKNGLCNPDNNTKSRRELIEESLEVFPLMDNGKLYGALQNGIHRFYEMTNGIERKGSMAKFSHLWIIENDHWKLKRVISFDHKMKDEQVISTIDIDNLDKFNGSYSTKNFGDVLISGHDDYLLLKVKDKEYKLFPIAKLIFKNDERPLTFEFKMDNNIVTKMLVKENETIVDEALKI